MGQRRLDDFGEAGDDAGGGSDADPTADGASDVDATPDAVHPTAPEGSPPDAGDDADESEREGAGLTAGPAAVTVAFTPGGAPCEACGERVERRWRDGDAMVCAACKAW